MIASSVARPISLSQRPAVARGQLGRLLADAGWPGDVDLVVLAVHEALVNSLHHAGGVTRATAAMDGGDVVVEVYDRGRGFAMPSSPDLPDPAAERGRGLFLIRRLASAADVSLVGDEVCLVLRFAP
jgi:anti-sigma regulatory factor (Ser/Thr protein kinase)